jgi:hypothetical protein
MQMSKFEFLLLAEMNYGTTYLPYDLVSHELDSRFYTPTQAQQVLTQSRLYLFLAGMDVRHRICS